MTGKPSAGRSVALSHFLTGTIRRSLDRAPLHGFDATAPGTGKSLIVDTSAMISMGMNARLSARAATKRNRKAVRRVAAGGRHDGQFRQLRKALGGVILTKR